MTKAQAIHEFWSRFGLDAYDESTTPDYDDIPSYPYITYEVKTDDIGNPLTITASLWDRSTSWKRISEKVDEISKAITTMQPPAMKIDGGRLYITKGTPFSQRMEDTDDMIRRIYLILNAEFLTAY